MRGRLVLMTSRGNICEREEGNADHLPTSSRDPVALMTATLCQVSETPYTLAHPETSHRDFAANLFPEPECALTHS